MGDLWQYLTVAAILACAVTYLVRRAWRMLRAKRNSPCAGCHHCRETILTNIRPGLIPKRGGLIPAPTKREANN